MPEHKTRPLTEEEMGALTKDLQEVLEKHGAEMGVTSTINLMKTSIPSPYATDNGEETKKEEGNQPESKTAEGGSESSGESS